MSQPISLTDLRHKLTVSAETGRPFDDVYGFDWDLADIGHIEVLALVDAVEAAHAVRDPNVDYTHDEGILALRRLDAALARFTFGGADE